MIFLRDDNHAFDAEYLFSAIYTLVCGESGVIHKDIHRRNAGVDGELFHGADFIIIHLSVIAAH